MAEVQLYVLGLISRPCIIFIMDQETLYGKLTALKTRLASTDLARE
jgi:hypothetical protein